VYKHLIGQLRGVVRRLDVFAHEVRDQQGHTDLGEAQATVVLPEFPDGVNAVSWCTDPLESSKVVEQDAPFRDTAWNEGIEICRLSICHGIKLQCSVLAERSRSQISW
jgi:hypothetical protein